MCTRARRRHDPPQVRFRNASWIDATHSSILTSQPAQPMTADPSAALAGDLIEATASGSRSFPCPPLAACQSRHRESPSSRSRLASLVGTGAPSSFHYSHSSHPTLWQTRPCCTRSTWSLQVSRCAPAHIPAQTRASRRTPLRMLCAHVCAVRVPASPYRWLPRQRTVPHRSGIITAAPAYTPPRNPCTIAPHMASTWAVLL
jgi:hypothetical protein